MLHAAKTIKLPKDLQAFAEECVRKGENASVADRAALAVGIAQLDAGLCMESSLEAFIARHAAKAGLIPSASTG